MNKALQDEFAPNSICYGCGPANEKGLQIKSFEDGDETHCEWTPESHHEAFPSMLNGGIIGSILDCHCNWTAARKLMTKHQMDHIPCTVTAQYTIKLLRPTPSSSPVKLKAQVVEYIGNDRAWVEAELVSGDKVCATCRGLFVAVKEGHPAYHRWG